MAYESSPGGGLVFDPYLFLGSELLVSLCFHLPGLLGFLLNTDTLVASARVL